MASRRQRNRKSRKARSPKPPAEAAAGPEDPTGPNQRAAGPDEATAWPGGSGTDRPAKEKGAAGKRAGGRFAVWADRLEETADERPPAPWGSFPLGPLAVLAGLVLLIIGALGGNPVQLAIGFALGALGGLELSIREHFAGFRSHTTLLAGLVFVIVVGLAYYVATIVLWACLLIGAVIAAAAFWSLRKAFEKASGGLSYRLR